MSVLSVKNAIYFFVFVFILVGVFGISAWVALDQLKGTPLSYAAIAFIWGIALAVLYLAFDKAGWDWWGS
jgi:glycerol uptake facilitator-like aquaporin